MFVKTIFHQRKNCRASRIKPRLAPGKTQARKSGRMNTPGRLLLPGALLVPIQTQLLAPFMPVDFCLAAFFD
jgi:hypothetical protein